MARTLFITGTDTEVGKTFVSAALLHAFSKAGLRTIGLKPVAAGCESSSQGLVNEDALTLQHFASVKLPYSQVNPVALEAPIAPHIAAQREGKNLSLSRLVGLCRGTLMAPHDMSIVEGAGGWLVPLNSRELLSDLALELRTPVILVVGLRLGCLNHALLTMEAIQRRGIPLAGWIGNQCQQESMAALEENLDTLKSAIRAPCLGILPYSKSPDDEAVQQALNISTLIPRDKAQ
ncbi:dethiobiotin synthase [Hahella sp. CCB-MM4]|uniref:dethiobiotin synthase n=1 Tax=Hahella sp. (strain CCB-MM4) TaxID=1926491 RepID=UPI000B9BF8FA|nr:dethiobiotin synthase [Hahella sp. CCB-MM4]OZG71511.1 dethiobiotin synthase [Hahella sp. CCB-MM4]